MSTFTEAWSSRPLLGREGELFIFEEDDEILDVLFVDAESPGHGRIRATSMASEDGWHITVGWVGPLQFLERGPDPHPLAALLALAKEHIQRKTAHPKEIP